MDKKEQKYKVGDCLCRKDNIGDTYIYLITRDDLDASEYGSTRYAADSIAIFNDHVGYYKGSLLTEDMVSGMKPFNKMVFDTVAGLIQRAGASAVKEVDKTLLGKSENE